MNYYNTDGKEISEKEYYEQVASESEFLEWYEKQDLGTYEKPSVTVDNVLFAYDKEINKVKLLLIKRKAHPYKNCWALTGGFIEPNEDSDEAVLREVKEEVNLDIPRECIEQLYTFSTPKRDPRTRIISISYLTFLPSFPELSAGDDADDYQWFTVETTHEHFYLTGDKDGTIIKIKSSVNEHEVGFEGNLAFDHDKIIREALIRVNGSLNWKPKVLNVLGDTFTLLDARKVYSQFSEIDYMNMVDNSNFKKTHGKLFIEVGEKKEKVGRPAKIFKLR